MTPSAPRSNRSFVPEQQSIQISFMLQGCDTKAAVEQPTQGMIRRWSVDQSITKQ